MGFLGGLLSTVAGGVMSLFGQQQQNDANSAQAADRYQVASADMKAAGLNPAMMFGSGGPAPMAPQQNVMSGLAQSMQQSVPTALAARTADKTIDVLTQQIAKMKADTLNSNVDAALKQAQIPWSAQNAQNKAFMLKSLASSADSDAAVDKNTAITARNIMGAVPATARKIADVAGFAGDKLDQTIAPVGSILGIVNSAKKAFSTGKSMRIFKDSDGNSSASAVNDNVSDDVWKQFLAQ